MENLLLKYMVERFQSEKEQKEEEQIYRPFITISREFGCPAKNIAAIIVDELNNMQKHARNFLPWTIISKEILLTASNELNIDASRINIIFNDKQRGVIDEVLNALSDKFYYSDRKILKTIDRIIIDFAKRGNVILLGRGGMAVTRDMPLGIHIRLFAPIEWRVTYLLETGRCSNRNQALDMSKQIDFKRNELIKSKSKNINYEDDFDVYYNCKYLSPTEIASSIISMMKEKKMI